MQIIDDKTVVVTTSNDLKEALSLDNGYLYIYFGNDINLESGFVINANKEKRYLNISQTLRRLNFYYYRWYIFK